MFKVFQAAGSISLEEDMNAWLKANPHTKIVLMSQSESWDDTQHLLNITVIVYYKRT